eukprot:6423567-Prymnesium_polylepis.1
MRGGSSRQAPKHAGGLQTSNRTSSLLTSMNGSRISAWVHSRLLSPCCSASRLSVMRLWASLECAPTAAIGPPFCPSRCEVAA